MVSNFVNFFGIWKSMSPSIFLMVRPSAVYQIFMLGKSSQFFRCSFVIVVFRLIPPYICHLVILLLNIRVFFMVLQYYIDIVISKLVNNLCIIYILIIVSKCYYFKILINTKVKYKHCLPHFVTLNETNTKTPNYVLWFFWDFHGFSFIENIKQIPFYWWNLFILSFRKLFSRRIVLEVFY